MGLWEKEMKLTDIRLEALNSAHQLDQLRETMHNMQVGPGRGGAAGGETGLEVRFWVLWSSSSFTGLSRRSPASFPAAPALLRSTPCLPGIG